MTNRARHVLLSDYIQVAQSGSSLAGSDLRKAVPGNRRRLFAFRTPIIAQVPYNHKEGWVDFTYVWYIHHEAFDALLVGDVTLPVAGEVHGRAALQGQRRNPVHLIAIRDPAVIFSP
jgi:hypothetical protein